MRSVLFFLFAVLYSAEVKSQDFSEPLFRKGTLAIGMAAGTRAYVGNWGLTANVFATKWLSLKLSGGIGFANYNGGIGSAGPEIFLPLSKRFYVCGGSAITGALGAYDVLGDDDTPEHHFYETGHGLYLRSSCGLVFTEKDGDIMYRLESGYSHALKTPGYMLLGPAPWTTSEIQKMERGLGSGLLISLSVQLVIRPDDWKHWKKQ